MGEKLSRHSETTVIFWDISPNCGLHQALSWTVLADRGLSASLHI